MASNVYRVKCGLLNVQSAKNKTFEIRDVINNECLDIFAITETWLTDFDSAVTVEMTPVTHTFFHNPRRVGRGGGVGLFLANSIKKGRKSRTRVFNSFELLQVECETNGNKVVILVVYRPPNSSASMFINEFRLHLDTIDMVSATVIICGDFNLWLDDSGARYVSLFIDTMATFSFGNYVDKPTSVGGHMIDLVFADTTCDIIHDLYVDDVCSISPVHKLITFKLTLEISRRQRKKISFRLKNKLDPNALIDTISNNIAAQYNNVCSHWSAFKEDCHECLYDLYNTVTRVEYEKMCPVRTKNVVIKDESPWFNDEILKAKKEKKKKEKLWRRCKTNDARREYNQARNFEKRLIEHRKREFYKEKTTLAGSNINKLYKVLDNLAGSRKRNKLPEGYTDSELASQFLTFFDAKISRILLSFNSDDSERLMRNVQVTEVKLSTFHAVSVSTVRDVIKRSNLTYCASDPMPLSLITSSENFEQIVTIITKMVNRSILDGIFPSSEKTAIVKPIIKGKLDPQSLSSFRPVSNLTFQSKILESVILLQLVDHLNTVGVIPDGQSAYRRLYSTETALCSVVSDMRGLLDEGKCGMLFLLDLSAAFDTVVHSILLLVCENFGIEGAALLYLKSYLEGRTYHVQIGDCFSDVKPLTRGVPQGSVLGPILFCIYTAELSSVLEKYGVKYKLFADDTQFYMSLTNIQDTETQLSAIMTDIRRWMDIRQLKLNENKTECLFVGRQIDFDRLHIRNLRVNDTELAVSKCVKNLGVLLDSELTMKEQINQTVKLAGYHLRNIAFVKKYLDEENIQRLIQNHVISKLDYCNSLYYGLPNYMLKKLQLIMNRAARLIKGQSFRQRITPVLIELHWLPVKARIVYKQCTMVHQALKYGKPEYMRNMLEEFHVETNVTLRHSAEVNRLLEPRFFREAGRRAFVNSAPRQYNRIPASIKMAENMSTFKRRLKTFLFTDCYDMDKKVIKEEYMC